MIQLDSNSSSTTIYISNWRKYQQDVSSTSSESQTVVITKQEEEKEGEELDTNVSKAETPRADIDEMFEWWFKITGLVIKGQRQKNRYACTNLLKIYGVEGLKSMIRGANSALGQAGAPQISDFVTMQSKQNALIAWGRGKSSPQPSQGASPYKTPRELGLPDLDVGY